MAEKKKITKEKETKIDKNLKKYAPLLIWIGIFAVIFVVFYLAFHNLGKIKYEGLTFTREKYGEIIIYHYYYFTELANGQMRKVDILLRGNPAESNVSMDGEIIYPQGKTVYLSINNSGLNECKYSQIALAEFSIFIANNGIVLKAGTPDKEEAGAKNQTYITCENHPSSMVISLMSGNESKIEQVSGSCYNAEVANCEILPVMEKFIVQSMIDAKKAA